VTELLLVGPRDGPLTTCQRLVRAQSPDWSVLHCADANSALERLEQRSADIVLACFKEITEYESLFAQLSQSSPGAIRLALFETLPSRVKGAHQSLATRGELRDLHPILLAAAAVSAKSAQHEGLKNIVSRFQDVPSPPLLYFDIREQLDNATGTAASMAEIASRDPALVARTLRIANSGFYARSRSVGDLTDAIGLIGTETLLGLVLAAHLYTGLPPPGLRLETIWQHTFEVSELARQISRIEGGDRHEVGHSFIAGLLHDIGLMVLLQNESARYQPMFQKSGGDESELARMEGETFGITHGELGALILMLWNLPAAIVDAVADSHASSEHNGSSGQTFPLPSRAVMAAEWLLDRKLPRDADSLPSPLSGTPEASLHNWFEARDQLVSRNC